MESGSLPPETLCLGPAPAFHRVKAGWAQWQVVLKGPPETMDEDPLPRQRFCSPPLGVGVILDVDPEGMA
jgi:hypothetical protein